MIFELIIGIKIGFIISLISITIYNFKYFNLHKRTLTFFCKRLLINRIKDRIINHYYYNNFERFDKCSKYDNNGRQISGKTIQTKYINEHKDWNRNEIIKDFSRNDKKNPLIFGDKINKKYYFNRKLSEKSLNELMYENYFVPGIHYNKENPNDPTNKVLIGDKGLYHHNDGKSFEERYITLYLQRIAIVIAIIAMLVSIFTLLN